MGNSQTKEARVPHSLSNTRLAREAGSSAAPLPRPEPRVDGGTSSHSAPSYESPRPRRGSRPDLSFLGIGGSSDRDSAGLEGRRETKQEREARRLEKERVTRLKERERSMNEEHVDGGYLVTQGVYVGIEDFNKGIVRQLMVRSRDGKAAPTTAHIYAD